MPPENKASSKEEPSTLEELTSDGEGAGLEVEKAEGAIQFPFDPAKIDVITQARTVDLLLAIRFNFASLAALTASSAATKIASLYTDDVTLASSAAILLDGPCFRR